MPSDTKILLQFKKISATEKPRKQQNMK